MLDSTRNLLWFHRAPHRFLADVAGPNDIATFRLGRRQAFLVNHPDLLRSVLVDQADAFGRGYLMKRAKRLLGDGLLTTEGAQHRWQRRLIQPTLSRTKMREHAPAIAERVSDWTERRVPGRPFDALEGTTELALQIIARQLFGVDLDTELDRLTRELEFLGRWAPLLAAPGASILTRLPGLSRIRRAVGEVDAIIRSQITAARRRGGRHVIAHLIERGGFDSDERLRDEVITLFMAGHDTTAAALAWTLILLAEHPAVAERLRDEPSFAPAIVKESLRLYPPAVRNGHRALRPVQLGRVTVPTGAVVFVSPYVTQRDRRWFDDPDSFRPERWVSNPPPAPLTYFPFGYGVRSCVGEHFAQAVLVAATTAVSQAWRLERADGRPIRESSVLTLKPIGARLIARPWEYFPARVAC